MHVLLQSARNTVIVKFRKTHIFLTKTVYVLWYKLGLLKFGVQQVRFTFSHPNTRSTNLASRQDFRTCLNNYR